MARPCGFKRRLDRRPADAALNARGAARRVDLEHPVEMAHVEADRAGIAVADDRLDAADDRRAAAERNDGDLRAARPIEHGRDVGFGLRAGRRDRARWRSRGRRRAPSPGRTCHKCAEAARKAPASGRRRARPAARCAARAARCRTLAAARSRRGSTPSFSATKRNRCSRSASVRPVSSKPQP